MASSGDNASVLPPAGLIGVVMPAYNAERWIQAALQSLQAQSVQNWIAVVVDDGSQDSTLERVRTIAEHDARISVVTQPNAGVAAARNAGLRALPESVDFVGFLDADDCYAVDALRTLRGALADRPDAVGVYGLARYVNERGGVMSQQHEQVQQDRRRMAGRRVVSEAPTADLTFEGLAISNPLWPAAVGMHRMPALTEAGLFDESMRVQEDWDLYLRMSSRGPFVALTECVADYRRHGANLTDDRAEHSFQNDHMRHKMFSAPGTTAAERSVLRDAWRRTELRQAREQARSVPEAARRRSWAVGMRLVGGAAVSLLTGLSRNPPRPNRRRAKLVSQQPYGTPAWEQDSGVAAFD